MERTHRFSQKKMPFRRSALHPATRIPVAGLIRFVLAGVAFVVSLQAAVVTSIAVPGAGLPTAPIGFSGSTLPGLRSGDPLDGGLLGGLLEGFTLATTLSGTYQSNVTQSAGQPGAPIVDDFILGVGGSLAYQSKATEWTFGGHYQGSYNSYFNNPDLSSYNQSGGIRVNYSGGKLNAAFTTGITSGSGSNRYYGTSSFIEQISISNGLSARYRLSPKTALAADVSQSFTTASGGSYHDTSSLGLGTSALWKYSPLTELGLGLRYTRNSGGGQLDRTTIGPTLTVNYKLSNKVSLNSRVGLDFVSYSDGRSADSSLSTSIALDYRASKLWGMDLSLYRDAQADPTRADTFTQITSLRLGYHRKIRRATLNLGVGYETNSTADSSNSSADTRPNRDCLSLDAALGMALFSNTTMAGLFLRYNDQSGGARESFDSTTVGFSLSRTF